MPQLMPPLPQSPPEPVTEVLYGTNVTDTYRWLEDQNSPRTRAWIEDQIAYARGYFESLPMRNKIHGRVRDFLAVETYDSFIIAGSNYFFRKRLPDQEQPCIYMREGPNGPDKLLVDPAERGMGTFLTVKPLRVSPDNRLLLYEVKEGGERTGTFEFLDIPSRRRLPDVLPRGYLRGFEFAPDSKSCFYVHEALHAPRPFYRAVFQHILGAEFKSDQEVFFAGEDKHARLSLLSDKKRLLFVIHHVLQNTITDCHTMPFEAPTVAIPIFQGIDSLIVFRLSEGRIFAVTDLDAPNRRVVEIHLRDRGDHEWIDVIPATDMLIKDWLIVGGHIFLSYAKQAAQQICIFDLSGRQLGTFPARSDETVRMIASSSQLNEVLIETESFVEPIAIHRFGLETNHRILWAKNSNAIDSTAYIHRRVWYRSKDGTSIPMFLVGRRDVLARSGNPTILTSYGGFGKLLTPQFSVFVAVLMEYGCLFALPNIRGGSEFGATWHEAAKGQRRQTAYDDFLAAAEWLISNNHAAPDGLAIFGGSNSGLLVGVAMTQRPELFRAVLCIGPLLDMLRYHLFDKAYFWRKEFGTVEDYADFKAISAYSPYQHVRDGVRYPAAMFVSGDADQTCNPSHARKMTARLQAASISEYPVVLDYSKFRGHSPVMPLSVRIDALANRIAFICDQLQIEV